MEAVNPRHRDMSLLQQTEELAKQYNIRPSRSKGQNFLIDERAYDAMIAAAELSGNETVLEVGPGLGFLTERLAAKSQNVIAVELDDKVAAVVKKRLEEKGITNATIYNEDILNFTGAWVTAARAALNFVVVANLPYNISSYFLRKFIAGNEGELLPERMTLMLQKEVGERLVAGPGDMSLLAVSVQFYCVPTLYSLVPAASFWPAPKVGSAVVRFVRDDSRKRQLASLSITEKEFFRVVKIGFSARRKMLKANLSAGLRLPLATVIEAFSTSSISTTVRAQELSLENWFQLIAALHKNMV